MVQFGSRKLSGVCTIAAIALIGGCQKGSIAVDNSGAPKATEAKVVRQDLVGYAFFDGKVVAPPGSQATVASPYDVAISEVLTSVGHRVGRGETIIKMNLPDVKASVDQAEINYRAAESAYAAAKTQYEAPVREAERALSEARAAEKAARVALQSGGSADLQAATEARIQAEAAVQAAKASVNSQILGEKQQLDYAAEYLKDARAGAKFANIKSPINGTVILLDVKPGQVVKTKEALATIVDLAAIRIQGVVPPEWKDKVVKGTQILISMEGTNSDPFTGQVKEVSVLPPSEGQASPGYLAVIDFNNEKGLVLPGSQVKRLGLKTGEVKDVLVVPVAAVQKNKDGKSVVYIQNGSNWTETMVETGLTDGALVEIKSGVKEGDVVKLS